MSLQGLCGGVGLAEDLYEEFIRELLNIRDDNVHMICDSREFFRVLGAKKDSRQAWKKQYYYRCLSVILAKAFIIVMERQQRNYVEAVDIYDVFPHYNFHITFRMLCELLAGHYRRGKCYTALTAEDYRHFIKLRDSTRTAEELMAKWKQYVDMRQGVKQGAGK